MSGPGSIDAVHWAGDWSDRQAKPRAPTCLPPMRRTSLLRSAYQGIPCRLRLPSHGRQGDSVVSPMPLSVARRAEIDEVFDEALDLPPLSATRG